MRCCEDKETVNSINNSDGNKCEGKAELLNIKICDSEEKNHLSNDNNAYLLDKDTVNPINVSENTAVTVDTVDNCGYADFHNFDQYLNSCIVCNVKEGTDFRTDAPITDSCINNYVEAELRKNDVVTDVVTDVTNITDIVTTDVVNTELRKNDVVIDVVTDVVTIVVVNDVTM